MSTHEENNVKFLSISDKIGKLLGVLPELRLILKERRAIRIIFEVLNRGRVQRRLASGRRCYGNVGVGRQDVIRVSELRLSPSQLAG